MTLSGIREDLKIAEEIKNKELTVDSDALRRDIASSRQEELSLMATDKHPTKLSSVDKTKSSSTAPISRGLSVYHNLIRQQMQPERTSSSSQSNTGDGSHQNEPKEQPPGSSSGYRSRYEEDKTSRSNQVKKHVPSARPSLEKFRNQINSQIQHKGPEKKTKWKAPITDHVERLVESRKKAGSGHADNERDRERIERDLRDSHRNGHDRERIERDLSESRRNGLDREREMNDREHQCETERERGRSELERERERSERDRDRERDRERERAERERDRNERERERERNEHDYKRSKDFIHTNGVLVDLNYRYNSKDTDALLRPELSSSARNSQACTSNAPLSHDSIKVNPLVEKYQHKTVNGHDMPPKNLDNYDPGNPIALKRRIADLESQVADMTEANETTQANLQEKQAKLVTLQGNWERRQRELEDDNANLRYKVSQLEAELLKSGSTQQLQDELVELRSDLRALRDKNHQLVQDNILLTEHLKDATRDQRSLSPTRKNLRNQDHPHRSGGLSQSTDRYRAERDINTRSLRNQFGGSCDVLYSSRQSSLGEIDRIHEKTKNAVISDKPSDKRYDERYDNRHQKAESPSSHERSTSPVSQRERRLSDVSDSTAILTSMPPTGIDEEGIDQTDTRRTTTAQANGNECEQ
ncbi:hypothetical protein CAPTEDRAFT_215471 [Capitella teleta]|uniref:Uncharacterized protein n=1 Tax=Capitella teleta TaxID=283909 RepID=R7TZT4_CAPTE|nr:hypothetical protein CAPTEDRAFT_215471 [Capitella teleta]|eukprot:ELT99137.1 hypothetical protein CAPTEDRAFT_215471 [Capitella teleta]